MFVEKYRIKIFPTAQNDLREIANYLNTLSATAATKYYDLIIEKISTLKNMPERCPLAKDAQLRLRGYRILIIKNYIAFYVVNGDTIEIRRILFARQQYEQML